MRLPDWNDVNRAGRWAAEVNRILNAELIGIRALISRRHTIGDILSLKPYTVAELANVTPTLGSYVMVSDEAGGAVPAFGDGTNWRRATDRAIVS